MRKLESGAVVHRTAQTGRPADEPAEAVRAHPPVVIAEDWPGTDTVVAVVVTENPADLPGAVPDVPESAW
ncbi:hypothetical protein [Streptomyces cellulosae]|uniref:hypothetical protein n=1 Tax=Streptomyces cellulosae TaxID=1968 RepID=UPI0004C63D7B|nr:hypothetical protein [Streptomyces cellulosae]